ncbi:MAG TPA: FtsX-like permease family protein [Flavitalea sp.]|nr:FtsX-like permease family protein [Flavitalea sp.]
MLENFLKIVIRNLRRYKAYTLINVIGLGIGIAAMVWGYQTYKFAFSFDNFHADRDSIYRGLTSKKGADGKKGIFPMVAVNAAKSDFAGIRETVLLDSRGLNIKPANGETFSEHVHFTNPSFFNVFTFPLINGNHDLNDRSAVLITEKIAKKYFGNEPAIGKTLTFYAGDSNAITLEVKGVLKDVPMNSTIQFNILTNFDNQLKPDGTKISPDDWKWFVDAAFFKISNPADAISLEKSLQKYIPVQNKWRDDWKVSEFKLISLRKSAVLSDFISDNNLSQRPDDSAAYGAIVFAFLILVSACLNFSNTTVARSNSRLKEIGMRKVMGSTYRYLILQMLMECAMIVLAAILLSAVFNSWWLPTFNKMFVFVDVQADYLHDYNLLLYLLVMFIATTLLAGAYPAFYISRFNPSTIFRGTVKFGGSNLFSRLMLGLQVAISIITVIGGIAFARNAEFQRTYDFGYNIENTIGVVVNDRNTFNAMKNELVSIPQITSVAGTRHHINFGYRKLVTEAEGVKKETNYFEIGKDYLDLMNLKIALGRAFNPAMESDYSNAILITEKMAADYGWKAKEALSKQMHIDTVTYSIVGVLKDFHSNMFFDPLQPAVMKLAKEDRFQFVIIQAKTADLTNVFEKAKAIWKKLFPLKPFNGFYQNEVKAESYRVTRSIAKVFSWFSIISILLTATGLFALVSLTMLKRMREIALRKVVGASPADILILINKGYFWVFFVSAILGCYGGWSLTKLLLDMIFKVNVGIESSTLFISVIILFVITACTIGFKVWQAVKINPIKLLRME